MLSGCDILCLANDWSADPTSKHHLMKRLSCDNRVLWVEVAGMRAPNLRHGKDWRRLARKARSVMTPP